MRPFVTQSTIAASHALSCPKGAGASLCKGPSRKRYRHVRPFPSTGTGRYSVLPSHVMMRLHTGWKRVWTSPTPKRKYQVIIVGAGGHGLATAYYLGRNFGITDVAVIEKGWLGGGNTGRNTTIIRSNYPQDSRRRSMTRR